MSRFIYSFFFKLFGWKIKGNIPNELKKYVMIVAPHTSNIDFFVGLA
ncbi:MAG TPA: acyltransferase, partial [Bacteroidia bacterium]|nr:acyltransferase [Bacteroidia bacterium]